MKFLATLHLHGQLLKLRVIRELNDNYLIFRPEPGSKTEQRGRKAHSHICREILELCAIIYDMGHYQSKCREAEENDTKDESPVIVRFGDLFQVNDDTKFCKKT